MSLQTFFVMLAQWPFDPGVIIGVVISAALYWFGVRYMQTHGLGRRLDWRRQALFALGLLTLFLTLDSPLDGLADTYLWSHMLQHELLALVAAPLLLAGEPALIMWRGIPMGIRRSLARWFVQSRWPVSLFETLERFFRKPVVSFLTFVGLFSVWHVPALYDLATENQIIHAFEHSCFIFGGLVFWSQFIPSFPFKPNMGYVWQSGYFALAALWGDFFGLGFMTVTTASYPYYAALTRTAGMMGAVTDQHVAGGVMDAFDTVFFITGAIIALSLWLQEVERKSDAEEREYRRQRQAQAAQSAKAAQ